MRGTNGLKSSRGSATDRSPLPLYSWKEVLLGLADTDQNVRIHFMEGLFKPPTMQAPLNDYPLQHIPTGLPVIFIIIHTEIDHPDFRRNVEHPFAGMIRKQNKDLIPGHFHQSISLGDSNPLDSPNIIYTIDAIGYPHITLLSTQPWLPIQQPDTSGNKQLYDVVYSTSDAISEGGMP